METLGFQPDQKELIRRADEILVAARDSSGEVYKTWPASPAEIKRFSQPKSGQAETIFLAQS